MPSAAERPEEEMPMPHLLYVAWGFPPSRAGGVYRALATVNGFASAGWRVTVLTAERDVFRRYTGQDTSIESQVADGVEVVRIPFAWPARDTNVRSYSLLRVALPRVWGRLRHVVDQVPFPEPSYGPWRRSLVKAARDVHDRDPVDLTIATANPYVTFAAADHLHRRFGVPYVMDYRDAWRLDVFSGAEVASAHSRIGRYETHLLASAREAWFVNEPIRSWYQQHYPGVADRMHVVANGWDPGLLGDVSSSGGHRKDPTAPPRFAYLGTLTPKVPVAELVAGWRLACADGRLPAGSTLTLGGHLGYFAIPQGNLAALVSGAADVGVRYVGPVPKTRVREFYGDADVLVLALGAGRYVTSGKVYEYVATRLPIVSIHDAGNATTSVLAGRPLVVPVDEVTPEAVASAFAEGARLADEVPTPGAAELLESAAQEYRRDRQLLPRIAALTEAVAP